MAEPLISVIVPVYKVEPYLDRCIESIVNQTYRNLEIILVDDGSPDNCPQMCDAWSEKDPRIKVIHKENGGLSDARNAGMAAATGELMGFVDSDDWIREDMYQLLYENMCEHNSDISACGVKMVWEDGTPERMLTKSGCSVLETEAAMRSVIHEDWLKQPVWYKLYKTELIRDIPFPVGKYHEDVFWTYQAIGAAKWVSVFDEPCYFYWQRSGSIMGEIYSLKRLDVIEAKQQRLLLLEKEYSQTVENARQDLIFSCMYHGQQAIRNLNITEQKIVLSKLKNIVREKAGKNNDAVFTHKCWLWLAAHNFELCCVLRNQLHIGL